MAKRRSSRTSQGKPDQKKPEPVAIPIEWDFREDVPGQYANHMVVIEGEHEFVLHFFALTSPGFFGSPEEMKKKIQALKSIKANSVAKIIVPRARYPDFVAALKTRLEGSRAADSEVDQ